MSGMIVFCGHKDVASLRASVSRSGQNYSPTDLVQKGTLPPTGKNVVRFTSEFAWALAKVPGLKWDELESDRILIFQTLMLDVWRLRGSVESDGSASHPSQKPVSLMNELLRVAIGKIVLIRSWGLDQHLNPLRR